MTPIAMGGLPEMSCTAQGVGAPIRLAVVVSHPIQHFVHFYRALAERREVALKVFFCSRIGLERYFDREMNCEIAWNMDLTGGFEHAFLPESDSIKGTSLREVDNPSIGRALVEFAPDVVLVYGYSQLTPLRVLAWCRRRRVPIMMTGDSELLRERGLWKRAMKSVALPAFLRQFTCFLTTGDNNEAYYLRYGVPRSRLFRAPLTIDETSYGLARRDRQRLRREFRAARGIDERTFVALAVGKLSESKRPRDLLQAVEMIRDAEGLARVQAIYAGNGSLYTALSTEVKAKTLPAALLGFVNVDELPAVYCGADILVHASELDAHPLVCAEAACTGLPLILSDRVGAAGPRDIARAGENAVVYPCGNVRALADALLRLAREPDTVAAMGRASQRIFDELDVRKSVEGTLAALHYCVEQRLGKRLPRGAT
jgi:glycosyltransferase involved in cell wall biosynthesis